MIKDESEWSLYYHYQKFDEFSLFAVLHSPRHSLVHLYLRGYTPARYFPYTYIHIYKGCLEKKEKDQVRKNERVREEMRVKAPPGIHVKVTYLHTSAEEAHLHARTNTDKHVRTIYSTALFYTPLSITVRSSARSFRSLLRGLPGRRYLALLQKKKDFACRSVAGAAIRFRVTFPEEQNYWEQRAILRCRPRRDSVDLTRAVVVSFSRRWHRYSVLEKIPAAWRTLRVARRSRSTFTFVRLLPVRVYRRGRFQPACRRFGRAWSGKENSLVPRRISNSTHRWKREKSKTFRILL